MKNAPGATCSNPQKAQVEFLEGFKKEGLESQKVHKLKDAALGKTQRNIKEFEELKTTQKTQAAESLF